MISKNLSAVAFAAAIAFALVFGGVPAGAQVDMSRYVALGDSFSAGYASGCLCLEAQQDGFARLLALQGRGSSVAFEQPLMSEPGIPAALRLSDGSPRRLAPGSGLGSPINLTLPRPYDNLSVPGARTGDVLRASSDGGGLRDLVLRGLGTQLEQALLLEPSFVSLWLGASDALAAAVSGIVLDGVTLTPAESFAADYDAIVHALVSAGVEAGVVATIPHVTDLPYVLSLAPEAVAALRGEAGGRPDPAPLLGPDGPLRPGDFLLMTASPLLARGDGTELDRGGSGRPLPDQVILSRAEARRINERIDEYNHAIRRAASGAGFALVDANHLFEDWRRQGVTLDAERFGSGHGEGLFSLDGIHPSPLGHALLANAFIEAINETYGGAIPVLDLEAPAWDRPATGFASAGASPVLFTSRAAKNLRFGLGVPRPARLLRLKQKALERSRELDRRRRERRYELPPEPRLAQRPVRLDAGAELPAL